MGQRLKDTGQWPLKAKWRVRLYSGSYNMKGMGPGDIDALYTIMKCSEEPMVDMAKYIFFGKDKNHACTSNFTTFALATFAQQLNINAPLLAAALKVNSKLFHTKLIEPSPSLFRCKGKYEEKLQPEEVNQFNEIKTLWTLDNYTSVVAYAKRL